jgi:hypothetical protein
MVAYHCLTIRWVVTAGRQHAAVTIAFLSKNGKPRREKLCVIRAGIVGVTLIGAKESGSGLILTV